MDPVTRLLNGAPPRLVPVVPRARRDTGRTAGRSRRRPAARAAAPPDRAPESRPGTPIRRPRSVRRGWRRATPPTMPIDALSSRNCAAMWPRVAPIARRRPISPVRSITPTRVMLAMPRAPTISDRPPSSRNIMSRSVCTSSRTRRGSCGTCTRSVRGSSGRSAAPRLLGDQVGGADPGLDDHRAGAEQAEIPSRGALGDDDRTKQFRLARHVAQETHDEVELVADSDGRQPRRRRECPGAARHPVPAPPHDRRGRSGPHQEGGPRRVRRAPPGTNPARLPAPRA